MIDICTEIGWHKDEEDCDCQVNGMKEEQQHFFSGVKFT